MRQLFHGQQLWHSTHPFTWLLIAFVVLTLSACKKNGGEDDEPQKTFSLNIKNEGSGSVISSPAGINCGSECSANFNKDTAVTLAASAGSEYDFESWNGDCNGNSACTIKMDSNHQVQAKFSPKARHNLTISLTGNGRVMSAPSGIDCGAKCSASFVRDTLVTLTATPVTGFRFNGWSGDCSGVSVSTCNVAMSTTRNVSANFAAEVSSTTLSVAVNGSGVVSSNPLGINCGSDCSEVYSSTTTATLTATAAAGFVFSAWSGDCSGTTLNCVVNMSSNRNVSATFTALPKYPLTVALVGSGTVSSAPAGINCASDCSESYDENATVVLTASAANGFSFSSWGGNCSGSTTNCTLTMTAARNVTATFVAANPQLTVSLIGSGSVSSNPAGINCGSDCSESYLSNSTVVLSATPATGFVFAGWSGSGVNCSGTGNCNLTLTSNLNVNATFNSVSNASATRVSVSGFGYVVAADKSISCGSVPDGIAATPSYKCLNRYGSGSISFTATPFSSSFKFDHWSGACASNSGNVCTLDVSTAKKFGAVFVPVSASTNVCAALNLKSDKAVYRLDGNFPSLAIGQSFVDPKFGTRIRRVTDVKNDGRGANNVLKTVYSTISAWNADESLLVLYRTDGAAATHELFNGRTYQFIRKLDNIDPVDLEQIYWDTNDPDILYYANRTNDTLYRYHVSTNSSAPIRNFTTQCGAKELHGGGDPLFNSWDSNKFSFACTANGSMFAYDVANNVIGTLATSHYDYGSPQAAPSGTLFLMNENGGSTSGAPATVRDFNMNVLRTLDLASGDEHGALSMNANGDDTWNAVAFDGGPNGSGSGTVVQHNLRTASSRVIVGESTGYPYPPSGTHVGATAFHRTGLLAVSIKDDLKGDSLLDDELLYIDADAATNPANSVCRVGHHRTASDDYWAEPHPSLSPSGTRIAFASSWGNTSATPVVNVFVVELPGYKP